jgi:sugar-specific transcriptional regulator TrmB
MNIAEQLEFLGLSEGEATVYSTLATLGPSLPTEIAKHTGIKRPTLYEVFPKLLEKGLLSETVKGKRKYFFAEDIQSFLDERQRQLDTVQAVVPELRALLATASSKPKILFYEGVEGIKKVYYDHLLVRQEILELVSIEQIHPDLQTYITNYYIPERARRKIPLKMLVNGKTTLEPWRVRTNSLEYREVRVFEEGILKTPLGLNIYGDNVSITLHREDTEAIGLIIRSKEIAETLRSIFIFLWGKAE